MIIVGATSGIGEGLARRYGERGGVRIGLIGRREELLKKISVSRPEVYEYAVCDVTEVAHVEDVLNGLASRLGGVDMLILSAGTGELNPTLKYEKERRTLDLNVTGWTFVVGWARTFFRAARCGASGGHNLGRRSEGQWSRAGL